MEENYVLDEAMPEVKEPKAPGQRGRKKQQVEDYNEPVVENEEPINCLKNQRVIVRFIKKMHPLIKDPQHIASGGLIEGGQRTFCLPKLSNGNYKNCLTNNEKKYLEIALGLGKNGLSIYNPDETNYWDIDNGKAVITLNKDDRVLYLSRPTDYILYKMLLANSDFICPSLRDLQNNPKASYQYVLINENDEARVADEEMNVTQRCYMKFGKYADSADTLRTILEMVQSKPIDENTKIEFLRQQINNQIKLNPKLFLNIIDDDYLEAKVIVRRAAKNGIISKRGDYYYLMEDNQPLCEVNEDPTLENAARFIANPKRNDLYIKIQAKLNPR